MGLMIQHGAPAEILVKPTRVIRFVGERGQKGDDAEFDPGILAGFMSKEEAYDRFALFEASIRLNSEQIELKVSRQEFNAFGVRLSNAETKISQTADAILLRATKEEFNALNQRVSSAEASITVSAAAINSKVSQTTYNAFTGQVNTRFSSIEQTAFGIIQTVQGLPTKQYVDDKLAGVVTGDVLVTYNTRISQLENQISLVATKQTTDLLGTRLATAEGRLDVQAGLIQLRVTNDVFNALGDRVGTAEGKISVMADQIQSKVSQSTVDVLTGRISNAESSITQFTNQIQLRVAYTDFNGQTIASLINQSPSSVKILAKNIQLEGAVTATSLQSGRTRININPDGDFEFLHGNGVVAFRMTTLSDGKAVFQAFNEGGEKVFDIDTVSQGGIQYVEAVPDKSVAVQINRIANFAGVQLTTEEENNLKNSAKALFDYRLATYPGYARDVQEVRIDKLLSPNAFNITIGIYPNADPSTGGYHTGSTTGTPYIQDGWYVGDGQYVGVKYHPADYGTEPQYALVTVFAVQNGKTMRQMNLSIQL